MALGFNIVYRGETRVEVENQGCIVWPHVIEPVALVVSWLPSNIAALVLEFDSHRGEILTICKNAKKGSTAESA